MSIMPQGGWGDLTSPEQRDPRRVAQDVSTSQTGYRSRGSYLTCKTCDYGTLTPKKVFRLSGPAVAIGYILLIPSILGMIACAVALIAVNIGLVSLGVSRPRLDASPHQSAFEASFRRNCAQSARQRIQEQGLNVSQQLIEAYCECGLAEYKETGSYTLAGETCNERAQEGALTSPSEDVDAFYSGRISGEEKSADSLWYTFLGAAGAVGNAHLIFLGVLCFVSGLLGWLLIMKKHVLQCDSCGAVTNAS